MESNETTFVPFSLSLWKLQMQVASLLFLGPFLFLTLCNEEELSGLQVNFSRIFRRFGSSDIWQISHLSPWSLASS